MYVVYNLVSLSNYIQLHRYPNTSVNGSTTESHPFRVADNSSGDEISINTAQQPVKIEQDVDTAQEVMSTNKRKNVSKSLVTTRNASTPHTNDEIETSSSRSNEHLDTTMDEESDLVSNHCCKLEIVHFFISVCSSR